MKLIYITNGVNGSGGLERVLSIKASLLADSYDYDVTILTLNEADDVPFYNFSPKIKFIRMYTNHCNKLEYLIVYRQQIQTAIDNLEPNVICVCDDGLKAFTLPSIITTTAKWVYERHVSKLIEDRGTANNVLKKLYVKFKWYLMDKLSNNFEKFILLTQKNCLEWSNTKNVIVISNPLSFTSNHIADSRNKKVICVGKISYQKGQDILVDIWKEIHKTYPDWELHLYGKEDLTVVDTLNLSDNIFFHPPSKEILEKYLESSIYVMPSRFEGFGMVLIEAMECGLPCISFNCNYGPSDIIVNNEDGFLVENDNTAQFQKRLELLMGNHDLRLNMGARAKQNVQRYSAANIIATWDRLFRDLVA
jgi:glycosyltransferase involved in cell wall biosynthesis